MLHLRKIALQQGSSRNRRRDSLRRVSLKKVKSAIRDYGSRFFARETSELIIKHLEDTLEHKNIVPKHIV